MKYYCKHCGLSFSDVRTLTAGTCQRHPDGYQKGRHELYEGSEKPKYTCKYCGLQFSTISTMTAGTCHRHPDGYQKGRHSPAL